MQRSEPFVLGPAENRPGSPERTPFKVLSQDTAGQLSMHEWSLPAWQSGPELHAHNFDEVFYVLDGELEMQIHGVRHLLSHGYLAWMPRNTPHTFANAGAQPVRVLTIATPGGLENVFAALAGDLSAFPSDVELEFLGPRIRSEKAPELQ